MYQVWRFVKLSFHPLSILSINEIAIKEKLRFLLKLKRVIYLKFHLHRPLDRQHTSSQLSISFSMPKMPMKLIERVNFFITMDQGFFILPDHRDFSVNILYKYQHILDTF